MSVFLGQTKDQNTTSLMLKDGYFFSSIANLRLKRSPE